MELRSQFGSEHFQISTVKVVGDGVIESMRSGVRRPRHRTACLISPLAEKAIIL
jgi:hypothetical protein